MKVTTTLNRRSFFASAAAAWSAARASATPTTKPLKPEEFKVALTGPILSIPTVFTADYRLDHEGLRNMIERALNGGIRVFALTKGNSMYDCLTYDEVKQLTRTTVNAVRGRGITIAATGAWWTGQAVDYARYAESSGADAVQVLIPPAPDEGLVRHFEAIAKSTRLGLVLHGQPTLDLLRRLLAIESIVAMKEEFTTDYTVPIYQEFGGRLNIFAGGTKARLLNYRPYGMNAYYSAFATFAPEIAMRFWRAVDRNDTVAARDVILKYDSPFFHRWTHAFWRATLEHFGVAKRYLRPPDASFSDAQMKEVRDFYATLDLA